jgi:hypothetical protein
MILWKRACFHKPFLPLCCRGEKETICHPVEEVMTNLLSFAGAFAAVVLNDDSLFFVADQQSQCKSLQGKGKAVHMNNIGVQRPDAS